MATTRSVSPFPWQLLDVVPRSSLAAMRALRRRLDLNLFASRLDAVASAFFATPTRIDWHAPRRQHGSSRRGTSSLHFELPTLGCDVELVLDVPLAARLAARVVARSLDIQDPFAPLDSALLGAAAAAVIHVVEQAKLGSTIVLGPPTSSCEDDLELEVDGVLHCGPAAHGVRLLLRVRPWHPSKLPSSSASLDQAVWMVTLPIVASTALAAREDLGRLMPGAAWLPGEGWGIDGSCLGRAALVAPNSSQGWSVNLEAGGQIVLGTDEVVVPSDEQNQSAANIDDNASLMQTVLDASVVVRVEVGSITLPAREWAALRPGDTVATGLELGEPVRLRIAGQVVALGELVNVEGELGVRIKELVSTVQP